MTAKERKQVTDLITHLKREWRAHPANGNFQAQRENQIRRDCLQAVTHFLNIDIETTMTPLPIDFDLDKHVREKRSIFRAGK
jgi:mRNA-degrading endonuclease YafQ of YafQ-DinJ toxin-antitoxin module